MHNYILAYLATCLHGSKDFGFWIYGTKKLKLGAYARREGQPRCCPQSKLGNREMKKKNLADISAPPPRI